MGLHVKNKTQVVHLIIHSSSQKKIKIIIFKKIKVTTNLKMTEKIQITNNIKKTSNLEHKNKKIL